MDFKKRAKELVAQMTTDEKISQICSEAVAIDRLGIPSHNWWNEALHGLARAGTATVFPQAIGMAASFNDGLLEQVADVISDEARAKFNAYRADETYGQSEDGHFGPEAKIYRGLTMFSPNINIFRDPRWGRGHETYGEDPYLTGRMGSAFVRGLQGKGEYHKCDATIKHYAVHSGPEGMRHGFNADITDEEFYDTYLRAFQYCIKHSHPASVMSAYNAVHGIPCSASHELLVDILRDTFGFDGYVVSDAWAISDVCSGHHYTENTRDAAAASLSNGCDLCLGPEYKTLREAFDKGMVTEERITEACERTMEARLRLGMLDHTEHDALRYEDVIDSEKARAINLQMARESVVLLKNKGILPLDKNKTIAVVGPAADERSVLIANYHGLASDQTTILEGIRRACTGRVLYEKGSDFYMGAGDCREEAFPIDARIVAARADVVVLCLGLMPSMEGEEMDSGWNGNVKGDKVGLELPIEQQRLLRAVLKMGKPVVCINVSGSAIALGEAEEGCDAVLQCFYPGARGGEAVAEILFGDVCPSGKLPVTFYRSTEDLPPFDCYSMKGRTYRFFEGKPLYPFAAGLSYTTFSYADAKRENGKVTVSVSNTGSMAAKETVLLFAEDDHPRLLDFQKIDLAPGETKTICFDDPEGYEKLFVGNGQPAFTPEGLGCHI